MAPELGAPDLSWRYHIYRVFKLLTCESGFGCSREVHKGRACGCATLKKYCFSSTSIFTRHSSTFTETGDSRPDT